MFTSTILFAAMATATPAPSSAQIANYTVVNQLSNPGFESGMSIWSSANSFVDPDWMGNINAYQPLYTEGTTTYTKRTGLRSYQFGLGSEDNAEDHIYSEITQNLATPVSANSIVSAQFYAWSDGSSVVGVKVEYTDDTPSYYSQSVYGNYFDPTPNMWTLVNFKSSLKAGRTIKKITIATEGFPYDMDNVYVDDVMLGKKVPLIVKL